MSSSLIVGVLISKVLVRTMYGSAIDLTRDILSVRDVFDENM